MLIIPAVTTDAMYEQAAEVSSRDDLQRFLEGLAHDYASNGEVWVNRSIPDFLRALSSCLQRSERIVTAAELEHGGPLSNWQYMARLLLASSVARVNRAEVPAMAPAALAGGADPVRPYKQPVAAVD